MVKQKDKIKNIVHRIFASLNNRLYIYSNKANNYELKKKGFLQVGKNTYGMYGVTILNNKGSENRVNIGNFCSFAGGIKIICGGIHPTNWVSTFPFRAHFNLPGKYEDGMPSTKGDIIIGNDVWISSDVTILSGVKIGNGAIISANAVVTKDVPAYSIVAGIPAKIIKYRFAEYQRNELENINWWYWDNDKLIKNVDLLSSPNIEEFIEKFK
jgi:acetyltransferase-like isoleucine patch superfamily enzyme